MSFLPYARRDAKSWLAASGSSLVLHVLVLGLAAGGLLSRFDLSHTPPETPQFTVTLERLQTDTLAGLTEQNGLAGAPDTQSATPDPEPSPAPETAVDTAGLASQLVEPALPEPASQTPVTQTVPPLVAPPAVTAPPDRLNPVIAQTVTAPLAPSTTAAQAGGTTRLTAVAPQGLQTLSAVAPSPPDTVQTPPHPAPPLSKRDLAIGDLIRRIRAAIADPCLLALPRRDGENGIGLEMVAASDRAMTEFVAHVLTDQDADLRQTRTLIDPRQCAAVQFIRQSRDYPATRLGLAIDRAEVPSGTRLTGVLRGVAGRFVTLALVDNNGVVQTLERFMTTTGNFARFSVPVTRNAPARDTSQILMAIASSAPTDIFARRNGQYAADVFKGLDTALSADIALAITTFDLR
ncbi:hypothetical protein BFP70_15635 [Thioclava sp. SK-1]|uniref:hypothetical protein n=1 Tax=Thioclava sp. SK-1 TaxID=1889770 RepID=UPI00082481C8|nr:hypothetical protein [Thioclava sp. SK-1]OCX61449.1 hypothetical protein BFP70_15635 [Thioclava sp. SK-1]